MKYLLSMNDSCIDCGLCTGNKYIRDNVEGVPSVSMGVIPDEKEAMIQDIVDLCPVGALELSEVKPISLDVCRKEIDMLINSLQLVYPNKTQFSYDRKYDSYSLSESTQDEYNYIYNSREDAKNAGCRSVERNLLCNRTNCVNQILNNYSIDKLAPYLEYKDCVGNFYFDSIKMAEDLLRKAYDFILLATEGYPVIEEYVTIDPIITNCREIEWNKRELNDLSGKALEIVRNIKRNTGDRFRIYIDTDDKSIEKNLMWGSKSSKKYAFCGIYKAAGEVRKDISAAVQQNFYKVQEHVYRQIEEVITKFQTVLIDDMRKKMNELLEDVQYYISYGSSCLSDNFHLHNTYPMVDNYYGRFGNSVKEFWENYSLKFGESVCVINNNTNQVEEVIIKAPKEDTSVKFSGEKYFDRYVLFKKIYRYHSVDVIRLDYLSGKTEVMARNELNNNDISIGYNDELHAWWRNNNYLYLWDSKNKQVKNVSTSGVYLYCNGDCIGSDKNYAYIKDDGCYKYSYQTGECIKISSDNWGYHLWYRNAELFYRTSPEPRKLCGEKENVIYVPVYPGPENLTANDDYIVWYQRGKEFYDRDVYVFNRKTKECKKILTFTEENRYQSRIYFWIKETVVEIVWLYTSQCNDRHKEVEKWNVSLRGGLLSHKVERLTKTQDVIVGILDNQWRLENTLPDIFSETCKNNKLIKKESDEKKKIQHWLDRVKLPDGYTALTVDQVMERRKYGAPSLKNQESVRLNKKEIGTCWNEFDILPCVPEERQINDIKTKRYEAFLQDHFYRKYMGYPVHEWFNIPENEQEVLFYNRVAYEAGHPEYMVETSHINEVTFESQPKPETRIRKNETLYSKRIW